MANKSFDEALKALKKAQEAARLIEPENEPDEPSVESCETQTERTPKFMMNFTLNRGMDSSEATERRIEKAEAEKKELENKKLDLKNNKVAGENKLRNRLGTAAIVFVSVQLGVCNIGIIIYFCYCISRGWGIPTNVILGWMAATLVETIGILWVIARSLFPFRDTYRNKQAEKKRRRK